MSNACSWEGVWEEGAWEWEAAPRAAGATAVPDHRPAARRPAAGRPAGDAEIIPFPAVRSGAEHRPLTARPRLRVRWGRLLGWAAALSLLVLLALPIRAIGG